MRILTVLATNLATLQLTNLWLFPPVLWSQVRQEYYKALNLDMFLNKTAKDLTNHQELVD